MDRTERQNLRKHLEQELANLEKGLPSLPGEEQIAQRIRIDGAKRQLQGLNELLAGDTASSEEGAKQ